MKPAKKTKFDRNEPVSVTGYTVTQKQFQLLANDDGMKQKLIQNKRWRQIIESIDDSKQPQSKLEEVMSNDPEFAQFVDYMLRVIGFRANVQQHSYNKKYDQSQKERVHVPVQDANLDAMSNNDKFKCLVKEMFQRAKE